LANKYNAGSVPAKRPTPNKIKQLILFMKIETATELPPVSRGWRQIHHRISDTLIIAPHRPARRNKKAA